MDYSNLKVLIVSSEVKPYSKSGGLGDVAGSLPVALKRLGVDARVIFPKYSSIPEDKLAGQTRLCSLTGHLSWRAQTANIYSITPKDDDEVQVYMVENDYYFGREGYYGYGDDYERFAFFSKISIEFLTRIGFKPDVLHFNDWQTGLGCTYLRDIYRNFIFYENMKSLFSIHNIRYQGIFGRETLWNVGLNDGYFTNGSLEFFGNISLLKAGVYHSDAVLTVSETYAQEILTNAYAYGLEGLLGKRAHENALFGVLNGIDTVSHDPATDKRIFVNYGKGSENTPDWLDPHDCIAKKRENKRQLQSMFGLPEADVPMLGVVSRLANQKGFDIIAVCLEELMSLDIQMVVLGTGEQRYEDLFRDFAWRYHDKISAQISFNDEIAQRIYAASDMFLMPSLFEPCGLGQMFAMRYGSSPIARKTGGLADTVKQYNYETREGTGFVFEDYLASGLMWAIREALHCYHSEHWSNVVKNCMESDFSWRRSALSYAKIYSDLIKQ